MLGDDDPIGFGKHRGTPMRDVPASYLDWLHGQDWLAERWPKILAYIEANRNVIDQQLEEESPF